MKKIVIILFILIGLFLVYALDIVSYKQMCVMSQSEDGAISDSCRYFWIFLGSSYF